ncbi:MAG: hypothetical protein M1839_004157 [Geoglossum umbratile]|nr:MAG: hypothetical protein M1839_004157 [Geoglossum umbratile]
MNLIQEQIQSLNKRSNLIAEMNETHLSQPVKFRDTIQKFNHAHWDSNSQGHSPSSYIQSTELFDQLDALKENATTIEETYKTLFIESSLLRSDVSHLQNSIRAMQSIRPAATAAPEQPDKTRPSMPRNERRGGNEKKATGGTPPFHLQGRSK